MLQVCGAHLRVIVPGQRSFFRRKVVVVASRWQQCVRFDRRTFKPQASRSRGECVIARPTGRFKLVGKN